MHVFDIEIYQNYFLLMFKNVETQEVRIFEKFHGQEPDLKAIEQLIKSEILVSFNGIKFDIPIISALLQGHSVSSLKTICDAIILKNLQPWIIERQFNIFMVEPKLHVDLIQVAPLMASLKIYGARLGCPKLQELPIEPSALIETSALIGPSDRENLIAYCRNDLDVTEALYRELKPQISLRWKMGKEFLSKSDAQIAELTIKNKLGLERIKVDVPLYVQYDPPSYISFESPILNDVLAHFTDNKIMINEDTGYPIPGKKYPLFQIGSTKYQIGLGGLHSKDKSIQHDTLDGSTLIDLDVAAFYPSIILNNQYKPSHLSDDFIRVYQDIVTRRLAAKASGDKVTNETLKIVINGSFGKFGSKYSALYSPKMLLQTTITGQLSLLMLIEQMELAGISVMSANTDGVLIKTKDEKEIFKVAKAWEKQTNFVLEETRFRQVNFQNVNNYLALGINNRFKGKGQFEDRSNGRGRLWSNPSCDVLGIAIRAYIKDKTPVEVTIRECKDISKFVAIRTVAGGAEKDKVFIGKAVRWYYNGSDSPITYIKNGNKVPKTDGARPLMDLPDNIPDDLDYQWYVDEANKQLKSLGVDITEEPS